MGLFEDRINNTDLTLERTSKRQQDLRLRARALKSQGVKAPVERHFTGPGGLSKFENAIETAERDLEKFGALLDFSWVLIQSFLDHN